eukprot:scaffold269448_cov18-Prasinocladus_malaysianus.AAC.1
MHRLNRPRVAGCKRPATCPADFMRLIIQFHTPLKPVCMWLFEVCIATLPYCAHHVINDAVARK